MAAKPLIGINVDYRSARKDSPAYCFLHAGYCNSLIKAGAVPMMIPPLDDEADMRRILDLLDGMLFIGGADLDCRTTGTCSIRRCGCWIRAARASTAG